jgi:hypothetical protein
MAIVSNTFTTYSAKGIREDLSNVITNIAPEETPYQSNIGRETTSPILCLSGRPTHWLMQPQMLSWKVTMLAHSMQLLQLFV